MGSGFEVLLYAARHALKEKDINVDWRPHLDYRKNHDYCYSYYNSNRSFHFLNIHDKNLNACGRMILEIVQRLDVLNQYVWGELW